MRWRAKKSIYWLLINLKSGQVSPYKTSLILTYFIIYEILFILPYRSIIFIRIL